MTNIGGHTVKSGPGLQTTPALQVLGMIGVVSAMFIVSVDDMIAIVCKSKKTLSELLHRESKGTALILFNWTQELPLRIPLLPFHRHLTMTLWVQLTLLFSAMADVGQEPSPRYRGGSTRTLGGVDRNCGVVYRIAALFRTGTCLFREA